MQRQAPIWAVLRCVPVRGLHFESRHLVAARRLLQLSACESGGPMWGCRELTSFGRIVLGRCYLRACMSSSILGRHDPGFRVRERCVGGVEGSVTAGRRYALLLYRLRIEAWIIS